MCNFWSFAQAVRPKIAHLIWFIFETAQFIILKKVENRPVLKKIGAAPPVLCKLAFALLNTWAAR